VRIGQFILLLKHRHRVVNSKCFPFPKQRKLTSLAADFVNDTSESSDSHSISTYESSSSSPIKPNAVFVTHMTKFPSFVTPGTTQIIRYGKGLEFLRDEEAFQQSTTSEVVLPGIMGSTLEGPLLLATGMIPRDVSFHDGQSLRS